MPDEQQALFSYCLTVGDREFAIQVAHEGVIHWDDYQERRRSRGAVTQHHVGSIMMSEPDAFTVSFELGAELLAGFRTAATMLEAGTWTTENERRLDDELVPMFWERVNPQLAHPLEVPPEQGS